MIWTWLSMFLISIVSALIPFLPIEAYIIGITATDPGVAASIWFGVAAGGGATVGKLIWYEAARRGVDSAWAQRKLAKPKIRAGYERWVARTQGRPAYAATVMFVAATVGIPPLLVMAAVGGLLRMSWWVFIPTVFAGRTIRFTLIFLGADYALHLL